jgi:hypothetical protein
MSRALPSALGLVPLFVGEDGSKAGGGCDAIQFVSVTNTMVTAVESRGFESRVRTEECTSGSGACGQADRTVYTSRWIGLGASGQNFAGAPPRLDQTASLIR